jgi:hypothetical protein
MSVLQALRPVLSTVVGCASSKSVHDTPPFAFNRQVERPDLANRDDRYSFKTDGLPLAVGGQHHRAGR